MYRLKPFASTVKLVLESHWALGVIPYGTVAAVCGKLMHFKCYLHVELGIENHLFFKTDVLFLSFSSINSFGIFAFSLDNLT